MPFPDEVFPSDSSDPFRTGEVERGQIIGLIVGWIEAMEPGDAYEIVACDPNKEPDRRHFTIKKLERQ